jgi:hypothetical protein
VTAANRRLPVRFDESLVGSWRERDERHAEARPGKVSGGEPGSLVGTVLCCPMTMCSLCFRLHFPTGPIRSTGVAVPR